MSNKVVTPESWHDCMQAFLDKSWPTLSEEEANKYKNKDGILCLGALMEHVTSELNPAPPTSS